MLATFGQLPVGSSSLSGDNFHLEVSDSEQTEGWANRHSRHNLLGLLRSIASQMRWLSLCPMAGLGHRVWEASLGQVYRGPTRTILCIDDDAAILTYERALLERSGYNVVTTTSALQGLTLAMMSKFDAVVLDYNMPTMNGHNLAAAIKKCRPDILIVMFSASEIPQETRNLVSAVVFKTDAIEQLLPTVAQLCNTDSLSE